MKKGIMKKIIFSLFILLIIVANAVGQIPAAKEFSKEISLYRAKEFVIDKILGQSDEVIQFEVDALAATSSGELTSLVYRCSSKNKQGLVLGFYGNMWDEKKGYYQAYNFKNLPEKEANEFLDKIQSAVDANIKYLEKDADNNNIYLHYQDLTVLIYKKGLDINFRIFWESFDAEWQASAFDKTVKRLRKKLK